jgi:hypothetical protein
MQRERWSCETLDQNLEDLLLVLNVALLNCEYYPDVQWEKSNAAEENIKCCRIIIDRPDWLCSVDETAVMIYVCWEHYGASKLGEHCSGKR